VAGAGFKTFSNGQILTAGDVQSYMMEQQIMVFANAGERDTTILSPSEGMFAFLKDINRLTVFTNSWRSF
jgi:hypothetical protein